MDAETKAVLAAICEILRSEMVYTNSVNNSMIALARAILQGEPQLAEKYREQWAQVALSIQGAAPPHTSRALERLGEIIQRLKDGP